MEQDLINLGKYLLSITEKYNIFVYTDNLRYAEKPIPPYIKSIILKKINRPLNFSEPFEFSPCRCRNKCNKRILVNMDGNPINEFIPYVKQLSIYNIMYLSCINGK